MLRKLALSAGVLGALLAPVWFGTFQQLSRAHDVFHRGVWEEHVRQTHAKVDYGSMRLLCQAEGAEAERVRAASNRETSDAVQRLRAEKDQQRAKLNALVGGSDTLSPELRQFMSSSKAAAERAQSDADARILASNAEWERDEGRRAVSKCVDRFLAVPALQLVDASLTAAGAWNVTELLLAPFFLTIMGGFLGVALGVLVAGKCGRLYLRWLVSKPAS